MTHESTPLEQPPPSGNRGGIGDALGSVLRGWFMEPDPVTGEYKFSWKKAGLNALGVVALAWAAAEWPILFWITMGLLVLGTVMAAANGGMPSFGRERTPDLYRARGRELNSPDRRQELEPELNLPNENTQVMLPTGSRLDIAETTGPEGRPDVPMNPNRQNKATVPSLLS